LDTYKIISLKHFIILSWDPDSKLVTGPGVPASLGVTDPFPDL
jgi:hypothetical protein